MFNYTTSDESKVEFLEIAPASELPNGERLFIEVEGRSLVIFNIAGQFFAIGDICSHDDGPVGDGDVEGYNIVCPRHGGEFDIRTGKAVQLPAVVDIPAYPVRVVDGMIQVGIPRE
jgi:3-phenylpropionate/trans-cinnamate dioxygenase ferredoxin subunit